MVRTSGDDHIYTHMIPSKRTVALTGESQNPSSRAELLSCHSTIRYCSTLYHAMSYAVPLLLAWIAHLGGLRQNALQTSASS